MYKKQIIEDIRTYQNGFVSGIACPVCDYYGDMARLDETKFLWGKFWLCVALSLFIPVAGTIIVFVACMFGCFYERYMICPKCRNILIFKPFK